MASGHWLDNWAKSLAQGSRRGFIAKLAAAAVPPVMGLVEPASAASPYSFRKATSTERTTLLRAANADLGFKALLNDAKGKGYKAGTARAYAATGPNGRRAQVLDLPLTKTANKIAAASAPLKGSFILRFNSVLEKDTKKTDKALRIAITVKNYTDYVEHHFNGKIEYFRMPPRLAGDFCTQSCRDVKGVVVSGITCQIMGSMWYLVKCTGGFGLCLLESPFADSAACELLNFACNSAVCRPDGGRCSPGGAGPRFDTGLNTATGLPGCCPGYHGWAGCRTSAGRFAGCCPIGTSCSTLANGSVGCKLVS